MTPQSWQGFRPKYYEDGRSWSSKVVPHLIENSGAFRCGSALKIVGGAGVGAADANPEFVAGFAMSFQTRNRMPVVSVSDNTLYVNGTYAASATLGDLYTAQSTNITSDKVICLMAPAEGLVVSGKLDADAGTTGGSDLANYYLNIEDTSSNYATLLDESSSVSTLECYKTVPVRGNESSCIDPDDPATASRRILCKVAELLEVGVATAETT